MNLNIGYIDKSIYKSNLIKESEQPVECVNRWFQEMIFIGLIEYVTDEVRDLELVYITDKGIEAYKAQTYHIIAANLLEAEASRKLARWAFYIAILSVILAIIAIGITLYNS